MTIVAYVVSVVLAAACIALFAVAIRRLFARHEEVVSTMLERYDDRLSEFAQTLNDAVTPLADRILAAIAEPKRGPALAVATHPGVAPAATGKGEDCG